MAVLYTTSFVGSVENLEDWDTDWNHLRGDSMELDGSGSLQPNVSAGWYGFTLWEGAAAPTTGYRKVTTNAYTDSWEIMIPIVHVADEDYGDGYVIRFPGNGDDCTLWEVIDTGMAGSATHTFTTAGGITPDAENLLVVEANPTTGDYTVTINGGTPETHNDTDYATGQCGIGNFLSTSPYDEPKFRDYQIEDDAGAPAGIEVFRRRREGA